MLQIGVTKHRTRSKMVERRLVRERSAFTPIKEEANKQDQLLQKSHASYRDLDLQRARECRMCRSLIESLEKRVLGVAIEDE